MPKCMFNGLVHIIFVANSMEISIEMLSIQRCIKNRQPYKYIYIHIVQKLFVVKGNPKWISLSKSKKSCFFLLLGSNGIRLLEKQLYSEQSREMVAFPYVILVKTAVYRFTDRTTVFREISLIPFRK